MRAIHKIAVLGAAVVAFGGIGVGTALADPPSGTVPAATDIVGVGSDTLTPLFAGSPTENASTSQALSFDYNHQSPAPTDKMYSWDAVNPSTGAAGDPIVTKSGCASIARPNGSGAGITALNLNTMDGTTGDFCIDFGRSSRAPNTTSFKDAFATQSRDAIAWSFPKVTGQTNPQPASLTLTQLQSIYKCTVTNWNQVGGTNAPIVPVVPQAGSGTRATWLGFMGVTTNPGCWIDGTDPFNSSAPPVEENTGLSTGNTDVFNHSGTFDWPLNQTTTTAVSADVIFPDSIGDWIAQGAQVTGTGTGTGAAKVGGHASTIWGHGNLNLGESAGVAATSTNSSGQPVINPSFPSSFLRLLYVVVRNGTANPTGPTTVSWPTTPANDVNLKSIFGPGGWACSNVTAQSDTISYGFTLLPAAACGALTAGD